MPVITAFELDDDVAPGEAARQTNRAHGRLRARTDEAHQFDGGHEFDDAACEPSFEFGRGAEGQAVRGYVLYRLDHLRVRVAQDHRPPGADVIDEAPPIGGGGIGAGGFLEEDRLAADAAKGAHR